MLRRDFLKFAAMVGAAIGVGPAPTLAEAKLPIFNQPKPKPDEQIIELSFGDGYMQFIATEGRLSWSEDRDYTFFFERGSLEAVRVDEGDEWITFSLDFCAVSVDTPNGFDEAFEAFRNHTGEFDLSYTSPESGETLVFPNCRWDTLEFDHAAATYSIDGRCPNVRANKTAGP